MRKFIALACIGLLGLLGCTPHTVISKTYNFNQMKRIGVMSFSNPWTELQGVENLFAKYLIEAGYQVVERAQLESVLKEHNLSVSGYLSPATTRQIGRILGVDALLIGEVSSYSPARTELRLTSTQHTKSEPVYSQDVMQLPDGTFVAYSRQVGTEYHHYTDVRPEEYTINAKVGIIAKLVDVETAEIIWIGSYEDSSSNALSAANYIARTLVKSFTKELAKLQEQK